MKDLWVINALAHPRPTLETYRYAMPGEENIPQSEMRVFDVATKQRVTVKADRFKDQTMSIATAPPRTNGRGAIRGGRIAGAVAQRLAGQAVLHAAEPRHAQARRRASPTPRPAR